MTTSYHFPHIIPACGLPAEFMLSTWRYPWRSFSLRPVFSPWVLRSMSCFLLVLFGYECSFCLKLCLIYGIGDSKRHFQVLNKKIIWKEPVELEPGGWWLGESAFQKILYALKFKGMFAFKKVRKSWNCDFWLCISAKCFWLHFQSDFHNIWWWYYFQESCHRKASPMRCVS